MLGGMQVTFAALWGVHHMMHMLWGKVVVSMGPSLVSTSMGAAVAALNFGLNFAFSQVSCFTASDTSESIHDQRCEHSHYFFLPC